MTEFAPVRTAADLATLDDEDVVSGYFDGLRGEPEPGNNRSRSYWHGWKNGMVDSRRREQDEHQAALAKEVFPTMFRELFGDER